MIFVFPGGSSAIEDLESCQSAAACQRSLKTLLTFGAPIHTFLKSYSEMNDCSVFGKVPNRNAKPRQSSKIIAKQSAWMGRRMLALGERCTLIPGPPRQHSRKQQEYSHLSHFSAECVGGLGGLH